MKKQIANVTLVVALIMPTQVLAQSVSDPPAVISPLQTERDVNGVNLATGKINLDIPSLGVPAAPRLHFDRVQNSAPYMRGTISAAGEEAPPSSYSVHSNGVASESFKCLDYDCTSVTYSGSTFIPMGNHRQNGQYIRAGGGEIYHFTLTSSDVVAGSTRTVQAYASSIDYPDGEIISFTYDSVACGLATCYRPTAIATTVGYFITVDYQCSDIFQGCWSIPLHAKLYAASDPNTPLQSLTYNSNATVMTDIGGRQWTMTGASNALGNPVEDGGGDVQLPTEASNSVTTGVASNAPLVGSYVRDGVTWTYTYTNPQVNPYSPYGAYTYSSITVTGPNGYSMSYHMNPTYQGIGAGFQNVVDQSTDALGRHTLYEYDPGMRLTKLTLPEGNYTQLGYDGCGNITNKTSVAKAGSGLPNIVETAVYPDDSSCLNLGVRQYRPTSYTDALGRVTNYTWNGAGQMTQEVDPADNAGVRRETDITYTFSGWHSRKTLVRVCGATTTCSGNAESHTEYSYWGETNLPATVTVKDEATGATRTTTYGYDAAGRPLSVDGPLAGTDDAKYFRYDVYGRKTWEIGAADVSGVRQAKRFTYRDSDDRVTKVESGTIPNPNSTDLTILETTDLTYDSRRYVIREATSSGGTIYKVADKSFLDRGLNDCATVRMNLASLPAATSTGACSLGMAGSEGPDRITKNSYDNGGQLTKVQKAYQVTTANGFPQTLQVDYVTYAYTNNGKHQTVTDANGNKAQYTYDGHDRLTKWAFPDKVTVGAVSTTDYEQYGYDAASNRTSLRKRDGSTLTYAFDNLNRVITKVVPSRADLTAAQVRDVYTTYDLANRPLAVKFDSFTGADGITNTYDGFGNLASSAISMAGFTKTLASQYDDGSRRTRLTHPDGAYFDLTYDARGQMDKAWWWTAASGTVQFMDINYESTGRRSNINRASSWTAYGYDAIGRLAWNRQDFVGTANDLTETFSYNPAHQITSQSRDNDAYAYGGLVGVNRNYAVNGLNQYTTAGPASFTYDANGNLITDGTNTYVYDIENRLVKATAAGATTDLTYDPLGRLWQVVKGSANTRFLYDGDELAAEYDDSGTIVRRFMFAGMDEPILEDAGGALNCSGTKFLHTDHLGSVVGQADCWGNRTNVNSYDEYGIPGSSNTGRFQYTGQAWLSELGIYYYKARMYSPTLGRFLQTDPVGYKDQFNLYAYVGDDPINGKDPKGEYNCQKDQCELIGKYVNQLRQAARTPETGSRLPNAALSGVVKVLGTQNDGNKIDIHLGKTSQADSLGETSLSQQGRVNILLDQSIGKNYALGGTIMAHEGAHGVQFLHRGHLRSLADAYQREHAAYTAQSKASELLGVSTRVWWPGINARERSSAIRAGAEDSCISTEIGGPETNWEQPFPNEKCP